MLSVENAPLPEGGRMEIQMKKKAIQFLLPFFVMFLLFSGCSVTHADGLESLFSPKKISRRSPL